MPQPLARINPKAHVVIGNAGDRPLTRHPELAVLALEAIASWSNVEAFLLRLFMQLLGGNESMAASVYLALDGQSAKSAAIRAAAGKSLESKPAELGVLDAIMAVARTNEKDRNKLAHWTWGDSPTLPDAVLLVDPRAKISGLDLSKIFVYKAQDFHSIIQANDRLCGFCQELKFVLDDHVANRDGRLLAELSAEPEIAERLARLAQRDGQQ